MCIFVSISVTTKRQIADQLMQGHQQFGPPEGAVDIKEELKRAGVTTGEEKKQNKVN